MFGCIYTPDFPVQAALRGKAPFRLTAAAVVDGPESLLKVIASNELARNAGVEIGMTKTQAESYGVAVLPKRVIEDEEAAQAALLDCGRSFSPRIESTAFGTVIVDLTGTERLLGTEQGIGKQIMQHSQAAGFEVNVGLAANPDTALCAVHGFAGITLIPPGDEAARLGCLPIDVLEPAEEILKTLESWGIATFRALAELPAIALTERLGQAGLHLQRVARGEVCRELVPAEPTDVFKQDMELEEPVELLEPLVFVLNRVLDDVMARLRERSLATDHVQVDLFLEVHPDRDVQALLTTSQAAAFQRVLKLPVPTQDTKVLLKLLQLDLAAHPPDAPVKKISLQAFPARLRLVQAGLFQPLTPEPAKFEITLARLRSVVGERDYRGRSRVGFPTVVDSHRPDDFEVLTISHDQDKTEPSTTQLALRMFRPPIPARVELNSNRAPIWAGFLGKRARVVHAAGPWRYGGDWWDASGTWMREEWDVHVSIDGADGLYRLFHDLAARRWFVEGMYD